MYIILIVYVLSFLTFLIFSINFRPFDFLEGLQNSNNLSADFCKSYTGAELEKKCHGFAKKKCQTTDCCYWNQKNENCLAGDKNGPLFQ
jgi:hypothetical protein